MRSTPREAECIADDTSRRTRILGRIRASALQFPAAPTRMSQITPWLTGSSVNLVIMSIEHFAGSKKSSWARSLPKHHIYNQTYWYLVDGKTCKSSQLSSLEGKVTVQVFVSNFRSIVSFVIMASLNHLPVVFCSINFGQTQ